MCPRAPFWICSSPGSRLVCRCHLRIAKSRGKEMPRWLRRAIRMSRARGSAALSLGRALLGTLFRSTPASKFEFEFGRRERRVYGYGTEKLSRCTVFICVCSGRNHKSFEGNVLWCSFCCRYNLVARTLGADGYAHPPGGRQTFHVLSQLPF